MKADLNIAPLIKTETTNDWKVVYVAPRSEKKVMSRLIELGMEAYVPLKKEKRQWSDRKKLVIIPLINGYVFVRVNSKQRDDVFKAHGVIQYVRYNGADAIVRAQEIEVLKSIEQKGYYTEAAPLTKFEKGQRTLINHGQFKGMFGIVEKESSSNVYTIYLESISYSVKINLPSEILTSAEHE